MQLLLVYALGIHVYVVKNNYFHRSMSLKLLQQLDSHEERVWSLSWNPTGSLFASCGGDKTIKIWGKGGDDWVCKSSLSAQHNRTVRSVTWSPCGNLLAAASFDSTVSIWDRSNGEFECISTLEGLCLFLGFPGNCV